MYSINLGDALTAAAVRPFLPIIPLFVLFLIKQNYPNISLYVVRYRFNIGTDAETKISSTYANISILISFKRKFSFFFNNHYNMEAQLTFNSIAANGSNLKRLLVNFFDT